MLRKKHRGGMAPRPKVAADHNAMSRYVNAFLEWSRERGRSDQAITTMAQALRRFAHWADERGIDRPQEVTLPILERYQRHLYHYRKANGDPLAFTTQQALLVPLKAFFRWAVRERHLLYNPASELVLPKIPQKLPRHVFSVEQVESILKEPDVGTVSGLRDRAMLETLYSTGIRRMELAHLAVYDLDVRRGTLMVRAGKGGKDRMVPIGARACAWVRKYLDDARGVLVVEPDRGTLFLTDFGEPFEKNRLGDLVKGYIERAGLKVTGSCHLFRHAMATHMLENGADIRFIQAILGHEALTSTQIYTQVSILKLKAIHTATHPARLGRARDVRDGQDEAKPHPTLEDARRALLAAVAADADDEDT
ncbi:MAG: site-specific tyrosine recombinase XerC [Burkholderiales bacterium]